MRKRYKEKKQSCALCKPWKRGWMKCQNYRELQELKDFEKLKHSL